MTEQLRFRVLDVTCEHCEARLQAALAALPGVQQVELERTPEDEADVIIRSTVDLVPSQIEKVVEAASAGTTHNYRLRWRSP